MLRTAIAISLTLAAIPAVAADIFKCTDPSGKVEYRNSNCPTGTKSAALDMTVATGKILDIRRSSDQRVMPPETKEIPDRPAATLAPRPSEPVNALPPAPPEKQK